APRRRAVPRSRPPEDAPQSRANDRPSRGVEGPYRGGERPRNRRGRCAGLRGRARRARRQTWHGLQCWPLALAAFAGRRLWALGWRAALDWWLTLEDTLQVVAVEGLELDQRLRHPIEHIAVVGDDRNRLRIPF